MQKNLTFGDTQPYIYIYTYTVSRVTYTDEYRACIWTSLGEFRYERYIYSIKYMIVHVCVC